jgi:chromosome segregation protein
MKLTKLRLLGFKSFVEATDFLIEPGLTGIVGPNGCGKSNLVEALRWVMGESSHKNLRAAEMDDVIFAGSGTRPSRNTAEVMLTVDNHDRKAPAAFNDADILEIARRIERDHGSHYRINGREVRARDVQLIFADASTGARSPAMVRQGQIAELIAAKPQARRRILEEAAGISGLHTRRHEAELRLKAAEQNLDRLEDVIGQISTQLDGLKRQSRQAQRYRALSAEIRKSEAVLFHLSFDEAGRQVIEAERRIEEDIRRVAERTRAQAEAARLAAVAAHEMPALREKEAAAAAALQRLNHARQALDQEEKRAGERLAELDRRIAQGHADINREKAMIADADAVIERLQAEATQLDADEAGAAGSKETLEARLVEASATLARHEAAMAEAQAAQAEQQARRGEAQRALSDAAERLRRLEAELATVERDHQAVAADAGEPARILALTTALDAAHQAQRAAEAAALAAEARHVQARSAETSSRAPLQEAERAAARLETETRTLAKLVAAPAGTQFPPVADRIKVRRGYETALGAALGDDLDAPVAEAAAARWGGASPGGDDPALPDGAEPLADKVEAPPELARRLAQIGVVAPEDGARLRPLLKPGQRLVSKDGDLWRWDGFVAAANAPTAAARRLAERNRLADLTAEAEEARRSVAPLKAAAEAAQAELAAAAEAERVTRAAWREATRTSEAARDALAGAERQMAQVASRLSALAEARSRLVERQDETRAQHRDAEAALAALPADGASAQRLDQARAVLAESRMAAAEARAAVQTLLRENELRGRRREAIAAERRSWTERQSGGSAQIEVLAARVSELKTERDGLDDAPALFAAKRRALLSEEQEAEARRREAADTLAAAETRLNEAERAGRGALEALSQAREEQVRTEERLDAMRTRRATLVREIEEALQVAPAGLLRLAGLAPGDALPPRDKVEKALDEGKRERERLGAVNLRAEEELAEVEAQHERLTTERDDLVEAIKRLRTAIGSLNREGRERLLAAFDSVNSHFQSLFTTLFDGGTAELQLTESEDPLEAGLDILARPPGKKPQTLSLLSGGEQALTAMALIFAVFLTNPAPICVLDEVDAPLDDANVERFCDLLEEMTRRTETRFVTITHNPITMARMNRLFGVTMAERGVSQLVSVNLTEAESLVEPEAYRQAS